MRKINLILVILMLSIVSTSHAALTANDEAFIKKTRQIRRLEKRIVSKEEEMRIAISELRTTFEADIDALAVQLKTAEADLEAIAP